MKLKDLIKCTGAISETVITGITCDTRNIKEGNAFVCINGAKFDGHTFAREAEKLGAAVVIAEKGTDAKHQVLVEDTHAAYFEMSAKWFGEPANDLKIIGVTGTNGKTSVTYMLKKILEAAGHKVGLIGTIQNMIGEQTMPAQNTTPNAYELNSLFSLMKLSGCDYVVMEVSSHALDQKRIYGIELEAALFTNLTQDHLDYHKTMENYFEAKKKLFKMSKTAIINFDDSYGRELFRSLECNVVTYSAINDAATYTAKNIQYYPDKIKYQIVGYNLIGNIKFGTGGKFTVYNTLCAVSTALTLGISLDVIGKALTEMKGVKGRAESVETGRNFSVIIDYAHTPDGLKNILNTFKECQGYRLVVLFGCGGDRDKTKRPLMGEVAAKYADYVIVTSDNPRSEEPRTIIDDILVGMQNSKTPYTVIENRVDAIKFTVENARDNDIIVLAGKGHETYQILSDKTVHLDEREVVKEALGI